MQEYNGSFYTRDRNEWQRVGEKDIFLVYELPTEAWFQGGEIVDGDVTNVVDILREATELTIIKFMGTNISSNATQEIQSMFPEAKIEVTD